MYDVDKALLPCSLPNQLELLLREPHQTCQSTALCDDDTTWAVQRSRTVGRS